MTVSHELRKAQLHTPIPGPKSLAFTAQEQDLIAPGLQSFAQMAGIVVDHASGSLITDVDDNRFIDFIGGIGVNCLGHSHPAWTEAVRQQAEKIAIGSFTSQSRIDLLQQLADHRPTRDIYRTQLYSSGAEAVESALRLAKCATGKWEVASFEGGFHGKTLGVMSLMGSSGKDGYGPLMTGSHVLPYADCYRCPLALTYPFCGLACVDLARDRLKRESSGAVAAFLVEPLQGTAGNVVPPPDWLQAIADLAREFDALLIVDEMITGFGRTGLYWGCWHSGAEPDIVTIGKQFGSGFPISGVMGREDVISAKPWSNPSGSSSSFGGNPLAAAAAAATLRTIDAEDLEGNARRMGAVMLDALKPLEDRLAFVGKVSGLGLLLGIEMVNDRATKTPVSRAWSQELFQRLLGNGLLSMAYSAHVRLQPPLSIDRPTLEEGLEILIDVLESMPLPD